MGPGTGALPPLPPSPTLKSMVLQYGKRRVAYSSRQTEIYRDLGFKPSETTSDNASVRVDHNSSQSEILAVHYTFDRYQDPNFDHTDFLPGLGGTELRSADRMHLFI